MAVNNFAPAEFGGYVLGVNGSGGGGGDIYGEFYGISGYAHVTINGNFPEDFGVPTLTYIGYTVGTMSGSDIYPEIMSCQMQFNNNNYTEVLIPLVEGYASTFGTSYENSDGSYVTANLSTATSTGDVTVDSENHRIIVEGDGSVTADFVYQD